MDDFLAWRREEKGIPQKPIIIPSMWIPLRVQSGVAGHGYIMGNTPLALHPQCDNFSCGNLLRLFCYSHS
jgi:hypothetical protein